MINIAAILPFSCYLPIKKAFPDDVDMQYYCSAMNWGPQNIRKRPFHMALTHLVLQSEDYANLFQELTGDGRYVILDNSLMENGHTALGFDKVLDAAKRINASEVVLPDVWLNADATVQSANNTLLECLDKPIKQKIAAVVHGTTKREWLWCYDRLVEMSGIDVIHIPKVMDKYWPGGRAALLHFMSNSGLISDRHQYHLLGIWNDPIELIACRKLHWIRSCDTALPGHSAYYYVELTDSGLPFDNQKTKRPANYFDIRFNPKQYDILRINLQKMDDYTN